MERSLTRDVGYPQMRAEVMSALQSLADPVHQRTRWGRVEAGVSYYDDLTLNLHILYDDTMVLPSPDDAVPAIVRTEEVPALRSLEGVLGPLVDDLGDSPDDTYLADSRWTGVVAAARAALEVMAEGDRAALNEP